MTAWKIGAAPVTPVDDLSGVRFAVADPHADGDVLRVADGPVVVIRLRGPRLHRDREREFEAAAPPEDVLARAVVGENVGDPVSGQRRDDWATLLVPPESP